MRVELYNETCFDGGGRLQCPTTPDMERSTRNKVTALCSDCAMPNDAEGVLTARQIFQVSLISVNALSTPAF
jgi:hypothetical protein